MSPQLAGQRNRRRAALPGTGPPVRDRHRLLSTCM